MFSYVLRLKQFQMEYYLNAVCVVRGCKAILCTKAQMSYNLDLKRTNLQGKGRLSLEASCPDLTRAWTVWQYSINQLP